MKAIKVVMLCGTLSIWEYRDLNICKKMLNYEWMWKMQDNRTIKKLIYFTKLNNFFA